MNLKYSVLLCFISVLKLFIFVNSASLPLSMLDNFIEAFNGNHCKMPEQIILQNVSKYESALDSAEEKPYDLAVPLAVCAAKVPASMNRDSDLCNEVFEILTNISTCVLNNTVLEKIESSINIPFEKEVCDGFSKYESIFIKDPLFVALKLADKNVCKWYCSGGEIYNACQFLLWSYRVQAAINDRLNNVNLKDSNGQSREIDKPIISNENEDLEPYPAEDNPDPVTEKVHSAGEVAHIDESKANALGTKKPSENVNHINKQSHVDETTLEAQSLSTGISQNDATGEKSHNGFTKKVTISKSIIPTNAATFDNSMKTASNVSGGIKVNLSPKPKELPVNVEKQVSAIRSFPLQIITTLAEKNGQNTETWVKQTGKEENTITSQGRTTVKSDQSLNPQRDNLKGDSIAEDQKNVKTTKIVAEINKTGTKTTTDNEKIAKTYAKTTKADAKTTKNVVSVMNDNHSTMNKASNNHFVDDKKIPSGSLEESSHEDPSNKKSTVSFKESKEDSVKSTNNPEGNKHEETVMKPEKPADKEGTVNSDIEAQAPLEEMEDGGDDDPDPGNFIDEGSIDDSFDNFPPKTDMGEVQPSLSGHDSNPGKGKEHLGIDDETGQSQKSVQINGNGLPDNILDGQSMNRIKPFPEQEDTHFFFYFLSIVVVIIGSYLVFHNKQKIIALIIEGRHEKKRRSHNISYKKLETK